MKSARSAVFPALLGILVGSTLPHAAAQHRADPARPPVTLARLAIPVSRAENRAVSLTNGRSAYFYTQTHRNDHPEHAWFRGLNLAGRRVFNDYHVTVNGAPLDPATASAVVFPDALVRRYPDGAVETVRLFDGRDVVEVALSGARGAVRLTLSGDQVTADGSERGVDFYRSRTDPATVDHLAVGRSGERFLIAVAPSRAAARALFDDAAAHSAAWRAERRARLERLLNGNAYLRTDDRRTTEALRWIILTTDQLLTRQRGDGIYAGLPWFNEYWGRDEFISLPGAALVTGRFEEARAILTSFARFQELDRASPFYGRLPNIVKPGSIDYHTTDGTPRWVIALRDYVRYSGDRALVRELYPNVAASIEGSFAHWTDADGLLVHADNETWMDARRNPDLASYSPRGTRANDIQALWYDQLRAGAGFAAQVGDTASARRWTAAAEKVRAAFAREFIDAAGRIADHVDGAGRPDFTLRPNLLFALDLVDDATAARATRTAWQRLVFPWGVATLDPADSLFHPYHLAWEHYHKDEAYHNGTVWPWLNGIAMQRMIDDGQVDAAYRLFGNMNELALTRGVVGGLPETMDAFPHPGETLPRLTGTYLQAWSNAEQLRVWYQCVLGIRPDLTRGEIVLAPRLPDALGFADFTVRVGAGTLRGVYDRAGGGRRYAYRLRGRPARLTLDLSPFAPRTFAAAAGDELVATWTGGGLRVRLLSPSGAVKEDVTLAPSPAREHRQTALAALFAGTAFAAPGNADAYPAMREVYRRP